MGQEQHSTSCLVVRQLDFQERADPATLESLNALGMVPSPISQPRAPLAQ